MLYLRFNKSLTNQVNYTGLVMTGRVSGLETYNMLYVITLDP